MDYTTTTSGIVTKFHFPVEDAVVQLVLVERPDKNIICYPSQIGCPLLCMFCHSELFVRSLHPSEIINLIEKVCKHITNKNKILLSCMGEGEISLSPHRFQLILALRRRFPEYALAISTTGINLDFFREMNVFKSALKIQLSLHATTVPKRLSLMPSNKTDVATLLYLFNEYGGKKEINYLLIDGVNDSDEDAHSLFKLAFDIPIKINKLSPNDNVQQSTRVDEFITCYKQYSDRIGYYETDGVDIQASCGMLTHQLTE